MSTETDVDMIPLVNLRARYLAHKDEYDAAWFRMQEATPYILGKEVEVLEAEVARFCGVKHAVGLNSGTDALELALWAYGIGEGAEVIVPAFTFIATAEVVATLGATPVFVDIDPLTYNIDPNGVADAINGLTRAIIPVNLYGLPADYPGISVAIGDREIPVFEDMAQSFGAMQGRRFSGSLADAGCISFFPAKNVGGMGDGGMLVTNNTTLAEGVRLLRNHGSSRKYWHEVLGTSSRLDTLQAAMLRISLRQTLEWNGGRRAIAEQYTEALQEVAGVLAVPGDIPGSVHVYQQYTIRVDRRAELQGFLRGRGIPTAVHYPTPLHLQPAFAYLVHKEGEFPESERAAREVLSLPMYPEMPDDHVQRVIDGIRSFYGA